MSQDERPDAEEADSEEGAATDGEPAPEEPSEPAEESSEPADAASSEAAGTESPERGEEDVDSADAAEPGTEEPGPDDAEGVEGAPVREDLVERVAEHDAALGREVGTLVDRALEVIGENERLEAELDEREETVEDLKSRLRRKQADFKNYKERQKRERERIKARATEDLIERLVDVRDNLLRALDVDVDDDESLRDGLEMTLREFDRVLEDENVEEIAPEPAGEIDPQRHEVMMRVDSDEPEGTVSELYRPGYLMDDKVIRPAQVTVSTGAAADTEDDGEASADPAEAEAIELGGDVEEPASEADGSDDERDPGESADTDEATDPGPAEGDDPEADGPEEDTDVDEPEASADAGEGDQDGPDGDRETEPAPEDDSER